MIDFKKMDDKDFVFVSKPLSDKEEKEFSAFLKARKTKAKRTQEPKKGKTLQNHHLYPSAPLRVRQAVGFAQGQKLHPASLKIRLARSYQRKWVGT